MNTGLTPQQRQLEPLLRELTHEQLMALSSVWDDIGRVTRNE